MIQNIKNINPKINDPPAKLKGLLISPKEDNKGFEII